MRCCGSFPAEQSITNRRFGTPTCTAASPTPGAAYMVSNILLTSFARSASNSVTGSAGVSSTGAGHLTISKTAMVRFYAIATKKHKKHKGAAQTGVVLLVLLCG